MTYSAGEIGLVAEVCKEGVEFVLDTGLEAREQKRDQSGERKLAIAAEGLGIEADGVEEFGGGEEFSKTYKNTQEARRRRVRNVHRLG